jgi:hypothetical protein
MQVTRQAPVDGAGGVGDPSGFVFQESPVETPDDRIQAVSNKRRQAADRGLGGPAL